jgi:hypothetical protein
MKRLIVLSPGMSGYDGWEPLIQRLSAEPDLQGAEWCRWDHGRKWYSGGTLDQLAHELRAFIDQQWMKGGPYDDVILVGHSMGGLLVRMTYLLGCGEDLVTHQLSPWAARVSRIILFAGLSRGFDAERNVALRLGQWLNRVVIPKRFGRLTSHLYRGSSAITNLRIQWIRHMAMLGPMAPVVVQLLGTRDELVTREDSIDIEQFDNGYYISVPDAGHADLYRLDKAKDADGRYALLRDAFVHARPTDAENRAVTGPGQVVFVLHGIRADNRTWVRDTIDAIRSRWPDVHVIGPRYEYFSALKFAMPTARRKNLGWFQDEYTQALARNPSARFSFIGHSNGTYLFGESLREIPGMRFERAALVGSVLPQEYDWDQILQRDQIDSIRVDGSCYDWPVGWLCSALRSMGMRDVGTAGFEGFTRFGIREKMHEFFWYEGGHSEPLAAANLPALAEFAVAGRIVQPAKTLPEGARWFAVVSRLLRVTSPLFALAALGALVATVILKPAVGLVVIAILLVIFIALDVG